MIVVVMNVELNVELNVEMVMLKKLILLVFLSIPNLLLFSLLIINLNLLFQFPLIPSNSLSFPLITFRYTSYNFSLYYHDL